MIRRTRLRADPEKVRDWQQRSRRRLPAASPQRIKDSIERRRVNAKVRKRDGDRCQAAGLVPEVLCWHPAGEPLDVHEVKPRSAGGDFLNPDECIAICRLHHRWVDDHPRLAQIRGLHRWSWEV